jgi:hypothetical protein
LKISYLTIFSYGNYVLLKIILFFASSNLKKQRIMKYVIIGGVASTAYNSWIGGESSEWSNAANWSNGLPTATQNVGIYKLALGSEANISSNISLNSLVISSSANPTISGSISTTQALATTKNITLLAGSTNNFGTLNVSSANQIIVPENSASGRRM